MVDPHYGAVHRAAEDQAAVLGAEDARPRMPQSGVGSQPLVLAQRQARRDAVHLGMVPFDGEEDGGGEQIVQVEGIARELPEVIGVQHEMASDGLLQAGVVLVANPRFERHAVVSAEDVCRQPARAGRAGQHEILVQRRLVGVRIGDAQYGPGGGDVIGEAQARLGLRALG